MTEYVVVTNEYVNVQITTSKDDTVYNDKRFYKNTTILNLKRKLELLTGGSADTMRIELYNKENKLLCVLANDDALLGSYPIDDGMRIHIVDKFSLRNELEFESVEKYEMPPETYEKKTDTVRAFLIRNKLGKYHEDAGNKQEQLQKEKENEKKMLELMKVGSRCQVSLPGAPKRKGCVKYTGKVDGLTGLWVGIQYDEPLGKNDGTMNGNRYFECPQNYGSFVKPQYVLCGDFPEDTYDFEDEL